MSRRFPPVSVKCPRFLHGGDYNPDQWRRYPEIFPEDLRLMKLAGCNALSVGIFAWSALEPQEGHYQFDWLDRVMDGLADNGCYAVLATPSGSKPAWMSAAYPEIRRVPFAGGPREVHGGRHNHCRTSPVYREKCVAINTRLAERYRQHPALILWHVSNEYNGNDCCCERCLAAFRDWLHRKFQGDLEALNDQYWADFWSHRFERWEDITQADPCVHGLHLDWRRFKTAQTIDFYLAESAPLRQITPDVPVTTNFMGFYQGLDYQEFAKVVDVAAWDSYPAWHDTPDDLSVAAATACVHDCYRSLKGGQPFLLMESVPSIPSRGHVTRRKRPGMHLLSSLQAVAHGSDSVQYFQWRKGRGGVEKFHGAVVDHVGTEHTRVFRDVARVGEALARLEPVLGCGTAAAVALVCDWQNAWALESAVGIGDPQYLGTVQAHYRPFWDRSVAVDVVASTADFTGYHLVVAPSLYMLRPGVAEALRDYVAGGGNLVLTYLSGYVNENDLCFLGGFPGGGLREVCGLWDEEPDTMQPFDTNAVVPVEGAPLGLAGEYAVRDLACVIHTEGAEVLATYGSDFYAGQPALTVNRFGEGRVWYQACRADDRFLNDFYGGLIADLGIVSAAPADPVPGISVTRRGDGEQQWLFVMNFHAEERMLALGDGTWRDLLSAAEHRQTLSLAPYGVAVLQQEESS